MFGVFSNSKWQGRGKHSSSGAWCAILNYVASDNNNNKGEKETTTVTTSTTTTVGQSPFGDVAVFFSTAFFRTQRLCDNIISIYTWKKGLWDSLKYKIDSLFLTKSAVDAEYWRRPDQSLLTALRPIGWVLMLADNTDMKAWICKEYWYVLCF